MRRARGELEHHSPFAAFRELRKSPSFRNWNKLMKQLMQNKKGVPCVHEACTCRNLMLECVSCFFLVYPHSLPFFFFFLEGWGMAFEIDKINIISCHLKIENSN